MVKEKGVTNYLMYGKEAQSGSIFNWEIVPIPKSALSCVRFWKQLKILWKIAFGSWPTSHIEREAIAKSFQNDKIHFQKFKYNKLIL